MTPTLRRSILLALAFAAQALAQTAERDARFKRYDKNNDGKITPDELGLPSAFKAADVNGDGFVLPSELEAYLKTRQSSRQSKAKAAPQRPARVDLPENVKVERDLRYRELPGVDANLHSLDVYAPKDAKNLPMMIYTHGGGWQGGDKANCTAKSALFTQAGFVFVSINYRLSPAVVHPAHIEDVVAALAWMKKNAARFGGDGSRLFLMGHSAGAHLTALAATDSAKLAAAGLSPSDFKGAVVLDNPAFDVMRLVRDGVAGNPATQPFGKDEASWRDASPQHHVAKDKAIPPMLLAVAASPAGEGRSGDKTGFNEGFAKALREAGVRCEVVDATAFASHESLNQNIGTPRDSVTAEVMRFVGSVLSPGQPAPGLSGTRKLASQEVGTPQPAPAPSVNSGTNSLTGRAKKNEKPPKVEATVPPPQPDKQPEPRAVNGGPWDFTFQRDFVPGSKDANGRILHATTCNALAIHDGKVWAGMSYVSEDRRAANSRILVKDAAGSPWREDLDLGDQVARVGMLFTASFTTDHTGKTLEKPVTVLVGGDWVTGRERSAGVWSRNDTTGQWHRETLSTDIARPDRLSNQNNPEVRAFLSHLDSVTGVHLVFALASNGSVFRGAYDPGAPGLIRWSKEPEIDGMIGRPVCATVANGIAYVPFAVDPRNPLAENGGLYRRLDGPQPKWERIELKQWRDPGRPEMLTRTAAMRGLTSLPDGDLIFSWKEPNYSIERLVPGAGFRSVIELDVRAYLASAWGGRQPAPHMIIGYNDMPEFTHPDTGERVNLIGLLAVHPQREGSEMGNSSWFLVRHADAGYSYGRVFDPADPVRNADIGLRGTRSIVLSPFPEHAGRVFYFGGFDEVNFKACGDRAWIYTATLPSKNKARQP